MDDSRDDAPDGDDPRGGDPGGGRSKSVGFEKLPADEGVGARIRAARRVRGMTQADLAQAVGVTRSAVAQWETDRSGQISGNLARIASVLGTPVEHLLNGAGPGAGGAQNATEQALLNLYRDCSEDDQALLLRVAVRLVRNRRPD